MSSSSEQNLIENKVNEGNMSHDDSDRSEDKLPIMRV